MSLIKNIHLIYPFLVIFILSPWIIHVQEYKGRVVGVSDGDTITVLVSGNQQIIVRLAEIDTPESAQPYGRRSKQKLSDLVFNKTVTVNVNVSDKDQYGRMIGRVYVDGVDVNAKMVEIGAAWVYRKYAKDQNLFDLEEKAKEHKLGLWSLPEADRVPPWEWRKLKRENASKSSQVSRPQYSTLGYGQHFRIYMWKQKRMWSNI